jgi:hypothetical protein
MISKRFPSDFAAISQLFRSVIPQRFRSEAIVKRFRSECGAIAKRLRSV